MPYPPNIPSDRGPSVAAFGPQGGGAPPPAVSLPQDISGPPIIPGLTKISPSRMANVQNYQQMQMMDDDGEESGPESLEDFMAAIAKIISQARTKNPEFVQPMLTLGQSLAQAYGMHGQMDAAAVVGNPLEQMPVSGPAGPGGMGGPTPSPSVPGMPQPMSRPRM